MAEHTLGNMVYWIRAKNDEFKRKVNESGKTIQGLDKKFNESKQTVKTWGQEVKSNLQKVSDFAKRNKEAIQSVVVGAGAAFAALTLEIRKATKENVEYKNSLIGLSSIAKSLKIDVDKATRAAKELSADGLMSISDAATGLKNLLQTGFSLDQAIVLMQRFKDAAAFGRQGALSFGEAIRSATEGVRQGNSILVDNAGVTKNLSVMLQEAGYSAQDLMRASDDAGVRMAIFNGILKETQHQVGDAAKLADELGGALSRTEESGRRLHRAIGAAIEGPLKRYLDTLDRIPNKTAEWIENNKELVGTITIGFTGMLAAILSISTGLLVLDKLVKVLRLIRTLAMENALAFAIRSWVSGAASATEAIGFLFTALKPFLVGGVIVAGIAAIGAGLYTMYQNAKLAKKEISEISDLQEALAKKKQLEEERDRIKRQIETRPKLEQMAAEGNPYVKTVLEGGRIGGVAIKAAEDVDVLNEKLAKTEEQLKKIDEKIKEIQGDSGVGQKPPDYTYKPPEFNLTEVMDQLEKDLADVDKVAATFGDTSNVAADKANLLKDAIIKLVKNGVDPTKTSMGNLVEQYKKYKQAAEDAKKKTYDVTKAKEDLLKALSDVDKKAAIFGDTVDADAEKLELFKDAIIEALVNEEPVENIQDLINEYNTLAKEIDNTTEALKRQQDSTNLLNIAQAELDNWQNRELSSLELLARQLEAQAALDEKNRDKLLEMADAMRKLADEQEKVTTAEENNKAATDLLAQAQEELAQMTGKALPSWEKFAQKLEEMADKKGVLPETAAQLREIAGLIREAGGDTGETNWLIEVFEDLGYKIEEAQNIFKNFKDSLIDGFTEMITKGKSLGDVFQQILDYLAEMIIKKSIVEPFVDWILGGIGLGSAHIGALVTPAGLVHDLPSYHSGGIIPGLHSDERIIKVLTGERILSREQNEKFEAGEYGKTEITNIFEINAVDAASFVQLVRRNPEAITSVVAGDIANNGQLRQVIKRYGK